MDETPKGLSDYIDSSGSTKASDIAREPAKDAKARSDEAVADVDQGVSLRPRWLRTTAEIQLEFTDG